MFSIDHIGVAVKSLAAAKGIYEKLGLNLAPEETVEGEQVRVVMVPLGESRLELLEPTSENSVIAKFIAKRGEGLHHVSLRVPDLEAAVERLEKRRRTAGFRRNQDRGGRASLRVRASFEHGWSAARVGGSGSLTSKDATDFRGFSRIEILQDASSRRRHFGQTRDHRAGAVRARRKLQCNRGSAA